MKLYTTSCYNPFFADVNGKPYEIGNILFFDRSGVICETGRGWFSMGASTNNEFRRGGLELPTVCTLKRKADFSLDSAFIIKIADNDDHIFGVRYALYIPAAVVGLQAPTVSRCKWEARHFEITYKSNIEGVGVVRWHFVDKALAPIQEKITKLGENLSHAYRETPESLQKYITELSALKREYTKEYNKMLAITPDEVLQQYRRAE